MGVSDIGHGVVCDRLIQRDERRIGQAVASEELTLGVLIQQGFQRG
jgi:hypothetical protein